jgi:hypothetical protein
VAGAGTVEPGGLPEEVALVEAIKRRAPSSMLALATAGISVVGDILTSSLAVGLQGQPCWPDWIMHLLTLTPW